jgi:hypothetical protein
MEIKREGLVYTIMMLEYEVEILLKEIKNTLWHMNPEEVRALKAFAVEVNFAAQKWGNYENKSEEAKAMGGKDQEARSERDCKEGGREGDSRRSPRPYTLPTG